VYKLLANRLKLCVDKCISEEQSTFLGEIHIDNVMVAIKIIRTMKRKDRGWKEDLALKIDIRCMIELIRVSL
jgi:hypothetical protein